MLNETFVYRVNADVRYRRVSEEGVVIRQRAGEVLVLNDVAMRIVELAQSGVSLSDLATRLVAEYEIEPARLEADLRGFVEELLEANVLERL
jgi:hypothetical protein